MERMITVLNGKNYLNMIVVAFSGNQAKMNAAIKKYDVIKQGVLEISRGGFMTSGFARVNLLVPEDM